MILTPLFVNINGIPIMYAVFQWLDSTRRPDDDPIRVETCSRSYKKKLMYLTYIWFVALLLTHRDVHYQSTHTCYRTSWPIYMTHFKSKTTWLLLYVASNPFCHCIRQNNTVIVTSFQTQIRRHAGVLTALQTLRSVTWQCSVKLVKNCTTGNLLTVQQSYLQGR